MGPGVEAQGAGNSLDSYHTSLCQDLHQPMPLCEARVCVGPSTHPSMETRGREGPIMEAQGTGIHQVPFIHTGTTQASPTYGDMPLKVPKTQRVHHSKQGTPSKYSQALKGQACTRVPRVHRIGPISTWSTCPGQLENAGSSELPVLSQHRANRRPLP